MSGLPEGWTRATGTDVFEYVTSGSRGWSQHYSSDGAKFIRIGNLNHNTIALDLRDIQHVQPPLNAEGKRTRLQPGDIVVSITAELGMVALIPDDIGEAYINQHVALARPKPGNDPRYLAWYLASDEDGKRQLRDLKRGATKVGLRLDDIRELQFPIPPLPEQKRIADKLDTLLARVDACREHLDRVPAILKRFRQSVLAAATSGELTREWRESNPGMVDSRPLARAVAKAHAAAGGHKAGNAAPPTDGVHDLSADMFPQGWSLLTLRDIVEPTRPITYGILKPGPELDEGVPYVRVADFPNDRLNLRTIRKTSPAMDEEFKRSRLRRGDVLLSIRGTVGRLVVVPSELENANITQDSARLSIQPEVNAAFVLWVLRSDLVQQRMRGAVKGVAVRGINIGDVRALQVPLPSRAEQDEIVRRVDTLLSQSDEIATLVERANRRVEVLAPSVLAKAFRGDLVPQDPTDEPAAALLARIAAARDHAGASGGKSRRRKATAPGPRA